MIFAIVDFPDPDSPTKPKVSPSRISKETLSIALTVFSSVNLFKIEPSVKTFDTFNTFNHL